jgi:orotate phosphoribosyltransferase
MENRVAKIYSMNNTKVALKVIPGHFATSNAHVNYYVDMTSLKTRQSEAAEVAKAIAEKYITNVVIDTIVCMDGCEVIGGFLAQELTKAGILNMNAHKTMYIITPEFNANGQLIFRENNQPAVSGKHVLLLIASVNTGKTVRRSLDCIKYYGGIAQGVSTIFTTIDQIDGLPVHSIFTKKDISGYHAYKIDECPFCKSGQKIEAIVNGYGYSKL